MKISLALSVLILAIGGMYCWHDHQQLVTSRETHDKLAAEAARFGISVDPKNPAKAVRLTKQGDRGEREDKDAEARLIAKEFIAFAKEMEVAEEKGGPVNKAMDKKFTDFMARIVSLDAPQLKIVIAEVKASNDLQDEMRRNLIGFSIMTLANDHPQAALTLLIESSTDSSGVVKTDGTGMEVISTALANWAKSDLVGALDWVKKNDGKYPSPAMDKAKRGMIFGVAANDPKLAFQLIGELGLTDKSEAISGIMASAKTPEERTSTLAALRGHLATLPDEKARDAAAGSALDELSRDLAKEGFASATQWVAKENLSPSELNSFVSGLTSSVKSDETGQWIEWIAEKAPTGKSSSKIHVMVVNWTMNDYQAAGKWLNATPDGRLKNIAVIAYAGAVASYEPKTAAQWAMTLPPGTPRDSLLKRIHDNWPKDDQAAKEAFATSTRSNSR